MYTHTHTHTHLHTHVHACTHADYGFTHWLVVVTAIAELPGRDYEPVSAAPDHCDDSVYPCPVSDWPLGNEL